jgi:DNA-sulfur modification-associated
LAALYDANNDLLKDHQDDDVEDNAKRLTEYWTVVSEYMTDWVKVLKGQKAATDLRAESISAHSTVLRALGSLGSELVKDPDWKERLGTLADIDWSKKNPDWQNVCIVANSVVSNRQARAAMKAYIKDRLNVGLTEAEQRSINTPLKPAAVAAPVNGYDTRTERRIDPRVLPNLTHTKVLNAEIDGEDVPNAKWNFLVNEMLRRGMQRVGSFEKLRQICPVNLFKGRKEDDGYNYLPDIDLSVQNQDANGACRTVVTAAQTLDVSLEIGFMWRLKEGAAHPGETGRINMIGRQHAGQ